MNVNIPIVLSSSKKPAINTSTQEKALSSNNAANDNPEKNDVGPNFRVSARLRS